MERKEIEAWLQRAAHTMNEWLDAPDDQVATPVFVVGPADEAVLVARLLGQAPHAFAHLPQWGVAYQGTALRPPRQIDLITRLTPARRAIFPVIDDVFWADRLLAMHPGATMIWLYTPMSRVTPREDDAEAIDAIRTHDRCPPELAEQLQTLAAKAVTAQDHALVRWYGLNSLLGAMPLQTGHRTFMASLAGLAAAPDDAFGALLRSLELQPNGTSLDELASLAAPALDTEGVEPTIKASCEALNDHLMGVG